MLHQQPILFQSELSSLLAALGERKQQALRAQHAIRKGDIARRAASLLPRSARLEMQLAELAAATCGPLQAILAQLGTLADGSLVVMVQQLARLLEMAEARRGYADELGRVVSAHEQAVQSLRASRGRVGRLGTSVEQAGLVAWLYV